jgi:hypothetical protein
MEKSDKNTQNDVMVNSVPGDLGACGWYRVVKPSSLLQSIGRDVTISPAGMFRYFGQNVIFTQRLFNRNVLELLKRLKDQTGCKIVCDCDDLLWTWKDGKVPEYNFCSKKVDCDENRKVMEEMLYSVADRVTVSTTSLRAAMEEFLPSDRIKLIPNCLSWSEWKFDLDMKVPSDPVFFFAGTSTHVGSKESGLYGDFSKPLVQYLANKKTMSKGFVPWFFNNCSMVPYSPIWRYAQDFRAEASKSTFIVAPLENNIFNICKSNLKYLESAAVGRVCRCTSFDGGPFEDVAHEYQKIPVDATVKHIDYIVKRALRNYNDILIHQYKILNEYWIENRASDWGEALLTV